MQQSPTRAKTPALFTSVTPATAAATFARLAVSVALLSSFASLGALGCAAPVPNPGSSSSGGVGERTGTTRAALSTDDAVSRGMEWVDAQLQYCQAPNGAPDPDPDCASVCERESNPDWDGYRSDCSGIVSYAWGLPAPGRTTGEFAPAQTDITYVIDAADLQPGDAINISSEHMMLFEQWVVPCQTATFIDESGCASSITYAHELTDNVTLDGSSITLSSTGQTFVAIRYGALTPGSTGALCGGSGDDAGADAGSWDASGGWDGGADAGNDQECFSDGDCGFGQGCDQGTCVSTSNPECYQDSDCGTGGVCEGGACWYVSQCYQDSDCGAGFSCNQGTCVSDAQCQQSSDCPVGQACNNGNCFAPPSSSQSTGCSSDSDCGGGQVCDEGSCVTPAQDGSGVALACESNSQCPAGNYCLFLFCIPAWGLPTCQSDSDCSGGQSCVAGACAPSGSAPGCTSNSACGAGETCVRGACGVVSPDGGISEVSVGAVGTDGGSLPPPATGQNADGGRVSSTPPGTAPLPGETASDAGITREQALLPGQPVGGCSIGSDSSGIPGPSGAPIAALFVLARLGRRRRRRRAAAA